MLQIRKRTMTTGLVVLAASFPAAAQAQFNTDIAPGTPPQATAIPIAPPAVPANSPANATTAGAGFQWGDAGIGAGGALLLLGAGTAVVVAGRRRHPQGPLAR
jgi:hypothetical protein